MMSGSMLVSSGTVASTKGIPREIPEETVVSTGEIREETPAQTRPPSRLHLLQPTTTDHNGASTSDASLSVVSERILSDTDGSTSDADIATATSVHWWRAVFALPERCHAPRGRPTYHAPPSVTHVEWLPRDDVLLRQ